MKDQEKEAPLTGEEYLRTIFKLDLSLKEEDHHGYLYVPEIIKALDEFASLKVKEALSPPPEEQKVKFETWLRGRIKRYKKEAEEMYGAGMADNSKSQNDAKAFKTWADSYAEIADELEETLSEYLKHTPKQKEGNNEYELLCALKGARSIVKQYVERVVPVSMTEMSIMLMELDRTISKFSPKAPEKEGGEKQ